MDRQTEAVVLEAVLDDAYDGAMRLLLDAQRFGLSLLSFSMLVGLEGTGKVILRFEARRDDDLSSIVDRIRRHPVVMDLRAI